jgi:hypothetical protein
MRSRTTALIVALLLVIASSAIGSHDAFGASPLRRIAAATHHTVLPGTTRTSTRQASLGRHLSRVRPSIGLERPVSVLQPVPRSAEWHVRPLDTRPSHRDATHLSI